MTHSRRRSEFKTLTRVPGRWYETSFLLPQRPVARRIGDRLSPGARVGGPDLSGCVTIHFTLSFKNPHRLYNPRVSLEPEIFHYLDDRTSGWAGSLLGAHTIVYCTPNHGTQDLQEPLDRGNPLSACNPLPCMPKNPVGRRSIEAARFAVLRFCVQRATPSYVESVFDVCLPHLARVCPPFRLLIRKRSAGVMRLSHTARAEYGSYTRHF